MSKNKRKNNRKPMNPRTKESLALGFRSILSNDACVELGRTRPWYGALIAGILSSIVVVIPTLVNGLKVKGSDIFNTPTYGLENGLVHFQRDVRDSGLDLKFDIIDHMLQVNQNTWNEFVTSEKGGGSTEEPWYHHYNSVTGFLDFQVYYTPTTGSALTSFAEAVYNGANPTGVGSVTFISEDAPTTLGKPSKTSALILGLDGFRIFKFNAASTLTFGGVAVEWRYDADDLPINNLVSSAPAADTTDSDVIEQYKVDTIKSWSPFFDKAYEVQRNVNAWRSTGIMWAIYSAFISFMGLLIWLMTRGKTNPFRIIQFWEAQKIAYWASPTPAILAMAFGFFMSTSGIMQFLFIFLAGMRIMWMSMRSLRPVE